MNRIHESEMQMTLKHEQCSIYRNHSVAETHPWMPSLTLQTTSWAAKESDADVTGLIIIDSTAVTLVCGDYPTK